MDDMDIDMDIDVPIDPVAEDLSHQVQAPIHQAAHVDSGFALPPSVAADSIPADTQPAPEKVHVRGLDSFSTEEVKRIASENFPLDNFVRVEWIDDTSANLIFDSAEAGAAALLALSAVQDVPAETLAPLQLRAAKRLSSHPLTDLYIRQATLADVKKKRAHEASRYYLMHPEQDPRERKKQYNGDRRPRQRRGSDDESDYVRRRFDDRELKRRRDASDFNVSMYDDDPVSDATDDRNYRKKVRFGQRGNAGEDLFGEKMAQKSGRLRDRSASPIRSDGDGRHGFGADDNMMARKHNRTRSQTPPRYNRVRTYDNSGKELFGPSSNTGRELFPQTMGGGSFLSSSANDTTPLKSPSQSEDLFAAKLASSKELFPNKAQGGGRSHRRTGAVDASPRNSIDFYNNGNGLEGFPEPKSQTRSLADRITGGTLSVKGAAGNGGDGGGLNIRGAAMDEGLSVRGAAGPAPSVRELFPLKAGSNVGKELFAEKIKGRGGQRRKAEDMFF